MAVELVQRTVPAAAVLVAIGCTAQPFLAQDQLGLVPHFVERDRLCRVGSPSAPQVKLRLLGRSILLKTPVVTIRPPPGIRISSRYRPPTCGSSAETSQSTPSGPIQACHTSRVNHASNTRAGGASNRRLITRVVTSVTFMVTYPSAFSSGN